MKPEAIDRRFRELFFESLTELRADNHYQHSSLSQYSLAHGFSFLIVPANFVGSIQPEETNRSRRR